MNSLIKGALMVLALVPIFIVSFFFYKAEQSKKMSPPSTLKNHQLAKCGQKPNCVSSFQHKTDKEHYIAPMKFNINPIEKVDVFLKKSCQLVSSTETYKHYECQSSFFGFTDDVEIFFKDNKLHFRSASRVGHSDLGANRKRINQLKQHLIK
ncbi:MAG: DUF1499 domain-containing protein [Bacteriovoracaceae bacterium]|jgi:uncharacterized protein (DUF1499 family)|nr:DUF1499 domain-containing protein [Bacteriovoracaceae bacterium]|tara:strand:+ start:300 stop:755 length:456 start_codon:yes stop_codon:yes gene_type:complete